MARKKKKARPQDIRAPQYWPTRLGLALLRTIALLPVAAQLRIGSWLGSLMYHLVPSRRRIAETNIRLSFPEMPARERERLVRESIRNVGIGVIEGGLAWWGRDAGLRPRVTIEGLEHLEAARKAGRGVLFLGGHYATLELSGRLVSYFLSDICPVYKPARNPAFESVMAGARRRYFDTLLVSKDMRTILRALRRGKIVWYAPDQDFGHRNTVFAPFMGEQAASLVMTARLATLSKAPVLPFYSERLPGGRYLLRIGPALEGFPSGDDIEDARRVNAAIEEQVRRTPEQYLWIHRRFKTRPPGEAPVY